MELKQRDVAPGVTAYFRSGTSDERCLVEVVDNHIYRRSKLAFDVERGEQWLDLGANIGAFALYCKVRGASAVCYEPDPECFEILSLNAPEFERYNFAVTNERLAFLPFWKGKQEEDYYRATAYPTKGLPRHSRGVLPNLHGSVLIHQNFDGVKMDIEGAEGGLLDDGLLPQCQKFCMEYHTSRDRSVAHLKSRLDFLRSRFKIVNYQPAYDRAIAAGGEIKTFFDRMVYAKDPY